MQVLSSAKEALLVTTLPIDTPDFYPAVFMACVRANLLLKGLRLRSRGGWGGCAGRWRAVVAAASSSLSLYRRLDLSCGDLLLLLFCGGGLADCECASMFSRPRGPRRSVLAPYPPVETDDSLLVPSIRAVPRRGDKSRCDVAPARSSRLRLRFEPWESSELESYTRPLSFPTGGDASLDRLGCGAMRDGDAPRLGEAILALGCGLADLEEEDETEWDETEVRRVGLDLCRASSSSS